MEQTIEQLNRTALRADLETRYGGVMGPAIYEQLMRPTAGPNNDPQCMEVLQLSEIAHRLRTHVRELIGQYRAAEGTSKTWAPNVVALFDGSGTKGEIFRAYHLYKKMNRDFHELYEVCMARTQAAHESYCLRRWYDDRASNTAE